MGGMRIMTGALSFAVLLSSAGCRAEISDARRDHVLAGSHGWIDLSLKAAPKAVGFDASVAGGGHLAVDAGLALNLLALLLFRVGRRKRA